MGKPLWDKCGSTTCMTTVGQPLSMALQKCTTYFSHIVLYNCLNLVKVPYFQDVCIVGYIIYFALSLAYFLKLHNLRFDYVFTPNEVHSIIDKLDFDDCLLNAFDSNTNNEPIANLKQINEIKSQLFTFEMDM